MRVMIVEYNAWLRDMLAAEFQAPDDYILVSSSAQDCVNQLDARPVDVLLLALGLPRHNGVEVLHEIQSYEDLQSIPVIVHAMRPQASYGIAGHVWRQYGVKDFLYALQVQPHDIARSVRQVAGPAT